MHSGCVVLLPTKPSEKTLITLLRSKTWRVLYPTKLEKGTDLFFFLHALPELVITRPCAHLHPKSKLIHFAKSSAVRHVSHADERRWLEFSLQSFSCSHKG